MAKLTGAKKKAFLDRMAKGRKKAARGSNPKKKAAKKTAKRKPQKKSAKKSSSRKATKKTTRKATARNQARSRKGQRKNPKRRRRNSDIDDAVSMYEKFHQQAPARIIEYEESVKYSGSFAELGKLKKLRVYLDKRNPNFEFTGFGDCQVISTPDGQNIYFNGGDQSIDLAALDISSSKDIVELGPCRYIEYHTTKGFHDFAPVDYWHLFGEDDGIYPRLGYDRLNRRLFLIGGNYQVKREGIVKLGRHFHMAKFAKKFSVASNPNRRKSSRPPAAKKGRKMAKAKNRRKAANGGNKKRKASRNPAKMYRKRRHNPSGIAATIGSPKDLVTGGIAGLMSAIATRQLPQIVLGTANTGVEGTRQTR